MKVRVRSKYVYRGNAEGAVEVEWLRLTKTFHFLFFTFDNWLESTSYSPTVLDALLELFKPRHKLFLSFSLVSNKYLLY